MKLTVKDCTTYSATIKLGFFESVATNDMIKQKLLDAGLKDITVEGSGKTRTARATYFGEAKTIELPTQIVSIQEI